MPPLDLQKIIDEKAQDGLQSPVANSATPDTQRSSPVPSRFDIDVSNEVSSSDLAEPVSLDDVRAERASREQNAATAGSLENFNTDLAEPTPFNNPEQFILSSLYGDREQTDAERQAERERRGITRTAEGISSSLESARERAVETTDFGEQSQALARTNEQIAQRQARFRREMRAFETDAEKRGVDRQFVQSERAKLEADATAELADLYIIQNAQQGNVQAARDYIDTAVDNRYRSIQIELLQRQAALAELIPTLEKEEKQRALQLQIALGEREQNIQSEIEEAKALRNSKLTAIQMAQYNGAPSSVIESILSAKTPEEVLTSGGAYGSYDMLDKKIKQRNYDLLGIKIQSETEARDAAKAARESGVLSEKQFEIANDLRKEVNNLQEVKDAKNLETDTASLLASLEQGNGVGDIAAINSFQRLVVDPGVAVREGDVALLQSAQSWADQKTLQAQGLWVGDKLTPEARKQMKQVVKDVYNLRVQFVDENTKQIRTIANEQGIDYGRYVGKNFATYEDIYSKVKPQANVIWGVSTDDYVNTTFTSLSSFNNPFGVTLE